MASADNQFRRVDDPTAVSTSPAHAPAGPPHRQHGSANAEIEVQGLHKSFGTHQVLCGLDLTILHGQLVAIVGGSGSGKTVLLEHIIGQMSPDAGRVLVADHSTDDAPLRDLSTLSEEELDTIRQQWAVIFQRNALFSGTVFENIALWLREIKRMPDRQIYRIATDALKSVGFDRPDRVLKQHREDLSGGMAKRVALARGLAMDPLIIFYDEPTTGLDPAHAHQIQELIRLTHEMHGRADVERTSLIITHDKDLLYRLQPRVVMLHEGKVFFDGTYAEFERSDSEIIRPYFDLMPGLHERLHLR